ncbi:MAG: S-layer family protein [Cyanobacteriota bacterium]|nr:S-layer family protein [Cyanobacteriota bacterium]
MGISNEFCPRKSRRSWSFFWSSLGLSILWSGSGAIAQIVPDSTLPDPSNVNIDGAELTIEGGTTRGSNLFHSFEEFSLPAGTEALFDNSLAIDNILTRVTGTNLSRIDGLIRANGTANLFLINPNGLIFGPNARLDIGGSFFASTADRVVFADNATFSATNPISDPLLTVSVPVGLQLDSAAAAIVVEGEGQILRADDDLLVPLQLEDVDTARNDWRALASRIGESSTTGLEVNPDRTLGLIGGNIRLEGGILSTDGGNIELAAVASGEWGLDGQLSAEPQLGDLQLSQHAIVNASGEGGGQVRVVADRVDIRGESFLIASTLGDRAGGDMTIRADRVDIDERSLVGTGTLDTGNSGNFILEARQVNLNDDSIVGSLTLAEGNAGAISIRARESITLDGESAAIAIALDSSGRAGDLSVFADRAIVRGGSRLSSSTFAAGEGGALWVNAAESIDLTGTSADNERASGFSARTFGSGNGGSLRVDTARLTLAEGGQISTSTESSSGNGGFIQINASESVEILGAGQKRRSGLFANVNFSDVNEPTTGDGGRIEVNTDRLVIRDGAFISATVARFNPGQGGSITVNAPESIEVSGTKPNGEPSLIIAETLGNGPAGDITLNTGRLILREGGQVSASTLGVGSGGTLRVNATESVEIVGTATTQLTPGIIEGGLEGSAISSLLAASGIEGIGPGSGDGGNLNLTTPSLVIRDGGEIAVSSIGTGNAGILDIQADEVSLDRGRITAATPSGKGGNITLNAETILLENNSQVSATAGGMGNNAGNITLTTDTLTALNNSDITANAGRGAGGRVSITTQGLFGTEFRQQPTSESDITATSELGPEFNGIVEIQTPDLEPGAGLVALPEELLDATTLLARGCDDYRGSQFIITGRGGLPQDPTQPLRSRPIWSDLRPMEENGENAVSVSEFEPIEPLVEATNWLVNDRGEVELVARIRGARPPWHREPTCEENGESLIPN